MAPLTPASQESDSISIAPLLQRLAYPAEAGIQHGPEKLRPVSADEIATAFALMFEDKLSHIQAGAFLTLLHSTGKDRQADVIAKCSECTRNATYQVEKGPLREIIKARGIKEGNYNGGLVSLSPLHSVPIEPM